MRLTRMLIPALATLAGCLTAPHTVGLTPSSYLAVNNPGRAWFVMNDDHEVILEGPRVIGDTAWGVVEGQQVAIRMADVKDIRVQRMAVVRTLAIPAVLVAGAVGGVVLVKSTKPTIDPFNGDSHDQPDSNPNGP